MMTAVVSDRGLSPVLWLVLSLWRLRLFLSTFEMNESLQLHFLWTKSKTRFSHPVTWGKFSRVRSPSLLNDDVDGRFLADADLGEDWCSVLACWFVTRCVPDLCHRKNPRQSLCRNTLGDDSPFCTGSTRSCHDTSERSPRHSAGNDVIRSRQQSARCHWTAKVIETEMTTTPSVPGDFSLPPPRKLNSIRYIV